MLGPLEIIFRTTQSHAHHVTVKKSQESKQFSAI